MNSVGFLVIFLFGLKWVYGSELSVVEEKDTIEVNYGPEPSSPLPPPHIKPQSKALQSTSMKAVPLATPIMTPAFTGYEEMSRKSILMKSGTTTVSPAMVPGADHKISRPKRKSVRFSINKQHPQQSSDQTSDLSGIHLNFCQTATISLIVNIRLLGLKFPHRCPANERIKISSYITGMIKNLPCDHEKLIIEEALTLMPPMYLNRLAYNRWVEEFGKWVLSRINSPVGINLSNILVPNKNNKNKSLKS